MPDRPAYTETYRGNDKHKRRPTRGVKGTFCPEWTHVAPDIDGNLGNDMFNHSWALTRAQFLLESSVCDIGSRERFATGDGVAFQVQPTNDGTFHGYPVPWDKVPAYLTRAWRNERRVTKRQISTYSEVGESIDWAMDSDDAG